MALKILKILGKKETEYEKYKDDFYWNMFYYQHLQGKLQYIIEVSFKMGWV